MRLKTETEIVHFASFIVQVLITLFLLGVNFTATSIDNFLNFLHLVKFFLVGDTNARLGTVLNARNLHGQLISNRNKPLFLEFLQYSGLTILNAIYSKGGDTYEILNKKRSIIDLSLTNSPHSVHNFEIEPTPFGVNSQTCHKALKTTIVLKPFEKVSISAPRRTKYGKITRKKHCKIIHPNY